MTGLEIHTLNQETAQELPAVLATRAGQIAAAGAALSANEAPEISGAFSLPSIGKAMALIPETDFELLPDASALTTLPENLPPIAAQEELLGNLQESKLMGELMRQARLSRLTGCFLRPSAPRNHNGYSSVKSQAAKEVGLGSYRGAHRIAHFLYQALTTNELPTKTELGMRVDHICRTPSCCNPLHTRLLSDKENNALKDKAGKLEKVIIGGAGFYIGDLFTKMPWLTHTLVSGDGEIPARVISTRMGPFALRAAGPDQTLVYGQKLVCEVYDSLRSPGKNTYVPKSRAKPFKPPKDNRELFHKNKFKKKRLPTQKELYEQAMAV